MRSKRAAHAKSLRQEELGVLQELREASTVQITVELRVELDELGKAFVDLVRSLDSIFVE